MLLGFVWLVFFSSHFHGFSCFLFCGGIKEGSQLSIAISWDFKMLRCPFCVFLEGTEYECLSYWRFSNCKMFSCFDTLNSLSSVILLCCCVVFWWFFVCLFGVFCVLFFVLFLFPLCSLFILSVRLPEGLIAGVVAQCSTNGHLFAWNGIKTMYYLTRDTKQPSSQDFISGAGQVSISKGRRKCPYVIFFRL